MIKKDKRNTTLAVECQNAKVVTSVHEKCLVQLEKTLHFPMCLYGEKTQHNMFRVPHSLRLQAPIGAFEMYLSPAFPSEKKLLKYFFASHFTSRC